jgi:hypothetical protein
MSPVWSRDGQAVYYRQGTRIYRVAVSITPTFASHAPELAVDIGVKVTNPDASAVFNSPFALGPDGKRFLVVRPAAEPVATYHVVANWSKELTALMSRAR